MRINGIDFPQQILNALRDSKLVVFAGAGVSTGVPAKLPLFEELAQAIAYGTGQSLKCDEPVDQFLGRLQRNDVDVSSIAATTLRKNCLGQVPEPTHLHRDLLRLYPRSESPLIVTTNFDLLFEKATIDMFDAEPEVYRAPALPLGRKFEGIVHVHGALDHPRDMILTDADFGRAYLTEGWAQRFLVELFGTFTVLFVGYSHRDTIMDYLAKALPVKEEKCRFALTNEIDPGRWRYLGIEPIRYSKLPHDDHGALYDGIRGLADHARRSILDWRREITEIAESPPSLNDQESDLIEDALKDPVKTRFFTAAAVSVEWVTWLEKRDHLAGLFGTSDLNERDVLLVEWLAEKFARAHSDELFLFIGRRYVKPHPKLWDELCRSVASKDNTPCNPDTLSRWVSLLLATAPAGLETEHPLLCLGKCCTKNKLLDRTVDVFDAMAASRLVVKRGLSWPDSNREEQSPRVDVELRFLSEHSTIKKLWNNDLKPNLDLVADPLLSSVIRHLAEQHRTLGAWQKATRDRNPASFRRSAIEPHEQDEYLQAVDVLINSARDSLEWLASNQPEKAVQWCDRLAGEESPLLRRLAVHTMSIRNDLKSSEKIGWLLAYMDLYDHTAHHELFVFLRKTYPKADQQQRMAVISAVLAYRSPEHKEKDTEAITAYRHFTWLDWLHKSAPDCSLVREALNDVLNCYPEFQPSSRPDLTHWMSSAPGGHQSPWTVDELLSKSAEEWAGKLSSFQDTGIHEPDRLGLNIAVSEAAKRKFEWGLDLADALAANGTWETDLWNTLIRVWSESKLDGITVCNVLKRLERNELYERYARPVADFLFSFVRGSDTQLAYKMLPQGNEIATNLRRHLKPEPVAFHFDHWLARARNHTAGILAYFWLHSLDHWRSQQEPRPSALNEVYRNAFSSIVKDETVLGRLGRSVLARHFSFLLGSDDKWTKSNLLPLFSNYAESEDYMAVWDGFLYGNLSSSSAELMKDALLEAVAQIVNDPLSERQNSFIRRYITMLTNFVDDPHIVWIPRFFDHADECARRAFALHIGDRLSKLSRVQKQEWWERWLKLYWTNRLNGVPKALDGGEVESILRWLPNLEAVFAEAVELAVWMPIENAKHDGEVLYRIRKSDLCENHPESVAKLLVYLEHINSEIYARTGERELIGILRNGDIPDRLKLELEELAASRGYT